MKAICKLSDLYIVEYADSAGPPGAFPSTLLLRDLLSHAHHHAGLHLDDLIMSVLEDHLVALSGWFETSLVVC